MSNEEANSYSTRGTKGEFANREVIPYVERYFGNRDRGRYRVVTIGDQ